MRWDIVLELRDASPMQKYSRINRILEEKIWIESEILFEYEGVNNSSGRGWINRVRESFKI